MFAAWIVSASSDAMPRCGMRHAAFGRAFFSARAGTAVSRARAPYMHAKTAFNRSRGPRPPVICGNYGRTGTENSRLSRAASYSAIG